jgi:hypothetical protein
MMDYLATRILFFRLMGKGSKQRPTNKEAFDANYEKIFPTGSSS